MTRDGACVIPSDKEGLAQWHNWALDAAPIIVRLQEGYEKRWLRRCLACRTIVAYEVAKATQSDGDKDVERTVCALSDAFVDSMELKKGFAR